MSTEQNFEVVVDGIDYSVAVSTSGNSDTFRVATNNGELVITESWGDCNPLKSLWNTWQYQSVHGAARTSMEIRCIKEAVTSEIKAHEEFCLELVENDPEAEALAAHQRAEEQLCREAKQAATETWKRAVQAASARADAAETKHVAERLSVTQKNIVFDGQEFGWERSESGSIKIDRALNEAARKSGLRGQAVGDFYSLAQKMASAL
jgi:hypothetical protein